MGSSRPLRSDQNNCVLGIVVEIHYASSYFRRKSYRFFLIGGELKMNHFKSIFQEQYEMLVMTSALLPNCFRSVGTRGGVAAESQVIIMSL